MNKWERRLSVAITTGLVTGCAYMPATFAMSDVQQEKVTPTNTFTTTLTGYHDNASDKFFDKQTEYIDAGVYDQTKNEYTFTQDTSINTNEKAIKVGRDLTINAINQNLNLNVISNTTADANGIGNFNRKLKIDVKDLNINVDGKDSLTNGIYLMQTNSDKVHTAIIDINGNVNINAQSNSYVYGMYTSGNSILTVNGNVTMRDENGSYGIKNNKGNAIGIYAEANKTALPESGLVNINGNVDMSVNGTGVYANGGGSTVNIAGGTIETNKNNKDKYALLAKSGTININQDNTQTVNIKGNIGLLGKDTNKSDVNVNFTTADSTFEGVIVNQTSGTPSKGEVSMTLSNGASWVNEQYGENTQFTGSVVDNFVGGKDKAHAGYIVQKDKNDLTINNYSGNTVVAYEHDGNGTDVNDYKAGNTVINHAEKDSSIKLVTSNSGIDMKNDTAIENTLSALSQKLEYTDKDKTNLQGEVGIASGLTSSSVGIKVGDIKFDENGLGHYEAGSMRDDVNYHIGDYENSMMRGARSAMTTSLLAWCDTASDMFFRTGQLRDGEQDGIWARTYGGKTTYEGNNINIKNNYWAGQLGYDKTLANGWSAGVAFDYQDGSADYLLDGTGDNNLYALGFYATKEYEDNSYLDLSAKFGKVKNEYKVYNEISQRLTGDYSANAYSLSAQYGKRFTQDDGSYIEPQAELTWSRVNGDDYNAYRGKDVMNIHQEAFDSMVGRIGVKAGKEMENGNVYAMLSLAHEFAGDVETTYFAKDGGLKSTKSDLSDTWSELTLGGSVNLSEYSTLYADVTTGLSGDFQHDWAANVGVKFLF